MLIACPHCGKTSSILTEKLSRLDYEVKCLRCQRSFRPSEAAGQTSPVPSVTPPAEGAQPPSSFPSQEVSAGPVNWKVCCNHPDQRSDCVCPGCQKGYCKDCVRMVQTAYICNTCNSLCISPEQQQKKEGELLQRSRNMLQEVPAILTYPFVDTISFVVLSLIVWIFAALGSFAFLYGGGAAVLFTQGLLMAYSFSALRRVAVGKMKSYLPDLGDIYDLLIPLFLGFGALLISAAPLILMMLVFPGAELYEADYDSDLASVAIESGLDPDASSLDEQAENEVASPSDEYAADESDAEEDDDYGDDEYGDEESSGVDEDPESAPSDEGEEDWEEEDLDSYGTPAYVRLLLFLAYVWKFAYAPIALIVAAVSGSFLQTINPAVGIDSIRRMGSVYWIAMVIYSIVTTLQLLAGMPLAGIPFLGSLVKAFADSYAALVIGCALGFAVFKKSKELGLE